MCAWHGENKVVTNTDANTSFPHGVSKVEHKGKKTKHADKIPSSLGLFIVDSSWFFVSGPRIQKKRRGGEIKEKIQKDCISRKQKKQKTKKKKPNKKRLQEKKKELNR